MKFVMMGFFGIVIIDNVLFLDDFIDVGVGMIVSFVMVVVGVGLVVFLFL